LLSDDFLFIYHNEYVEIDFFLSATSCVPFFRLLPTDTINSQSFPLGLMHSRCFLADRKQQKQQQEQEHLPKPKFIRMMMYYRKQNCS
jgi:hypothetical protein